MTDNDKPKDNTEVQNERDRAASPLNAKFEATRQNNSNPADERMAQRRALARRRFLRQV
jgi:hypothetical protein